MSSRTKKANQAKRLNDLRFVIEEFLASEKFECPSNEDEIKACWERLDEIFSRSSDSVSEAGWEDKENANYVQGIAAGQESRSFGRPGNQQMTTSGARVRSLPRT